MTSVNKISKIIFILFCNYVSVFSQEPLEVQFNYAKSLYDEENYFDAVTEFKRLLFFDKSEKYSYLANKMIGLSYKQGAKFSDAIRYLTLAEINAPTADDIYNCRIEIIRINILRRTTSKAVSMLDSLSDDPRFVSDTEDINYWKGWAFIFSDDWEKASETFALIDINHPLKNFCDSIDYDLYNVTLAKVLSHIPGFGQFYTGEYVSGLISIGWNVLWGYLTINSFVEDRVFDGAMIGALLWWRFYSGNLQNAEKFALQKNLEKTNSALRFLQNNFNGEKP
jgi:tetratricopeptide (TPR) repeat protein